MRLGLRSLLRLCVGPLNPLGLRFWPNSTYPRKHVKIDDEEQQSEGFSGPTIPWACPRLVLFKLKMLLFGPLLFFILLLFIAYVIYKPPEFVINFLQWKYPDVLFQVPVPPTQRVVALTMDDAPSTETAKILDLLKSHRAKATFFVIGSQIASHPGLLQRIHNDGHEIGNHAWRDEPSVNLPLAELQRQVKKVEELLPANSNGSKYFRPGSGFFSKNLLENVKSLGYRIVLGGIYPHDPQIRSPEINARHVLSMVRPGGIIIMHDRRSYSAQQLELVLKGLAARNWRIESIGGLLELGEGRKRAKIG